VTDLREYMTPREFADLSSDAHHAVWAAHRDGEIDAVPASPRGAILLYRRDQVTALLGELEEAHRG
jgi:hypothetical protein